MSTFTATIQLQQAVEKDYEKLNSEMKKASFHLIKTRSNNKTVTIPGGEYNSGNYAGIPEATNAVYKAVKKTGLNYSFTIAQKKRHL